MTRHPEMTPELQARLAATIGRKAWDLNEKLTKMLAGQDVTLAQIDLRPKPGETPLERLRRYFNLVVAAQKRARTDAYGLCLACGEPIPVAELEEMPWRERHPCCEDLLPEESR